MMRRLGVLALALWGSACSGDAPPGTFCPTLNDQGPALAAGPHLLVANSLGEDWVAVNLNDLDTPLPVRGLTGAVPNDLDVEGTRLYAVNSGDNTITVVDLTTGRTVGCIDLGAGSNPWTLVPDPADSSRAWVTTFLSGELVELDLASLTVRRRVTVGPALEGLWVSEDAIAVTLTGYRGGEGNFGNGAIVFYDKPSLTEQARLPLPPNPQFLFTGADQRIHAVCTGNFGSVPGRIVRVEADGSAVRDTLELGGSPSRAALGPDGIAVVTAFYGGVMAYDTRTLAVVRGTDSPILPEAGYTAPLIVGDRVALANFDLDAVAWVRWGTWDLLGGFLAGDGPVALALTP